MTGQIILDLRVLRTEDGRELCHVRRPGTSFLGVVFSADGKLLAASSMSNRRASVELWDAEQGKELQRLDLPQGTAECLAFSPDGRTLAAGTQIGPLAPNGSPIATGPSVLVWELATKQVRCRFEGQRFVRCLTYAPDGRTLASGGSDATVLLWDLTGRILLAAGKESFSDQELAEFWLVLDRPDAEQAFRAMAHLQASPEQAVALLEKNLHPAKKTAAGPKEVAELITQLSDSKFDVRDRAHKRLEELGDEAAEPLRQALKSPESEEQRRRIDKILEKLDRRILTAEEVRQIRSVALLDALASPAARDLLSRLAEGAPSTRQTLEARAALKRLGSEQR